MCRVAVTNRVFTGTEGANDVMPPLRCETLTDPVKFVN